MRRARRTVLWTAVAVAVVFVAIQFVPYGRDHANPPVVREPAWPGGEPPALVRGACMDCHSNETVWPWYASVAPASWLVQRDVRQGREELNLSEWEFAAREGAFVMKRIDDVVRDGEMPPLQYRVAHASARLDESQKERLLRQFRAALVP